MKLDANENIEELCESDDSAQPTNLIDNLTRKSSSKVNKMGMSSTAIIRPEATHDNSAHWVTHGP